MADFDVIVVGAGVAGSTAAYKMATEGLDVLLIDRAADIGSKNLSGGVFYGRVLPDLIPGFYDEAPIERRIIRNIITFTRPSDALSIDYSNREFAGDDANAANGFTVLRAKFDAWLAEKAEGAGASLVPGICVDDLIIEDGVCKGIVADGEEMTAECVVVADGINSKLTEKLGQRKGFDIHAMGVGVKSLYSLDEEIINDRFHCRSGEGVSYGIMGDVSEGVPGGGFVYTNANSLSVGLVVHIDHLAESGKTPYELLDHMVSNPEIAVLLEGANMVEYGAHMVAEGGSANVPSSIYGDGWMIVGDAAGFASNNGFTVRGMDYAAMSGLLAAQTAIEAKAAGRWDSATLGAYKAKVADSFIEKDMATYSEAPAFMKDERVYTAPSEIACSIFSAIYRQDSAPKRNLLPMAKEAIKKSGMGLLGFGKLALKAVRSL